MLCNDTAHMSCNHTAHMSCNHTAHARTGKGRPRTNTQPCGKSEGGCTQQPRVDLWQKSNDEDHCTRQKHLMHKEAEENKPRAEETDARARRAAHRHRTYAHCPPRKWLYSPTDSSDSPTDSTDSTDPTDSDLSPARRAAQDGRAPIKACSIMFAHRTYWQFDWRPHYHLQTHHSQIHTSTSPCIIPCGSTWRRGKMSLPKAVQ